jgi:hypothetical protein
MIGGRRDRQLASRLAAIEAKIDGLYSRLSTTPQTTSLGPSDASIELDRAREESHKAEHDVRRRLDRLQDILQVLYDREPEMRERLHNLRQEATYERAFDEPEPLVSVVIPTYDRGRLLIDRAIPSVLQQSYKSI